MDSKKKNQWQPDDGGGDGTMNSLFGGGGQQEPKGPDPVFAGKRLVESRDDRESENWPTLVPLFLFHAFF